VEPYAATRGPVNEPSSVRKVCTPVDDPSLPPPTPDELIERMLEAGPRYNVEWVD
jgi:hypothetical protein